MSRTVLVTGAGGGIGRLTVRRFAQRGFTVYASDRATPPQLELPAELSARVKPMVLDVTSEESVAAARAQIESLDVLVNNADIGLMGPMAEVRDEDFRRMFEVNVLGLSRATRAFAPLLAGGGRVINLGSLAGVITVPFMGAYCASKHAVEAVTDALRMELAPLGVRVSLVQPAIVNTGFVNKAIDSMAGYSRGWSDAIERTSSMRASLQFSELDPDQVARTVVGAALSRWPRARYPVGRLASLAIRLSKWLPALLTDAILRAVVGLHRDPALESHPERSVVT